jgi:hypothetical protein
MELKSKSESVIELVNKLFVYTDTQQWAKLLKEVFTEKITFDMSSLGAGPPKEITAKEVCDMWKTGFAGIDHVHHQSGNFIVNFKDEDGIEADVFCYAVASHFKQSATQGKTREFVGSYDLHASFTDQGWRLSSFKYNLKYVNGNAELK